jgi:hypothetical protein
LEGEAAVDQVDLPVGLVGSGDKRRRSRVLRIVSKTVVFE